MSIPNERGVPALISSCSTESAAASVESRGFLLRLVRFGVPTLLWTFIIIAAPTFVMILAHQRRDEQEDFAAYYYAALEMRHGIDPYTTDLTQAARESGLNIHAISHSNEPPTFLAVIIGPLTHLPLERAYWIWQTVNLVCIVTAMFLLLRPGVILPLELALTLAALAAVYPAVISVFWFSQSKLVALALLVLVMRLMDRHPRLAGFTLALAAMLRGFPFVLGGYLFLQQRWRVVVSAITGVLIIGIATIWIVGPATSLSFVSTLPTVYVDHWNFIRSDFSIYFVVSRQIWAVSPKPGLLLDLLRCLLIVGIQFFVLAASCRATLMLPAETDPDHRLFSLWVATAICLLPVAWDHDLTLMLIPFAQLAVVGARREASRRAIAMAIISYLLLVWWKYVALSDNEGGFLSMLAAYLSAYWLATDQPGTSAARLARFGLDLYTDCGIRSPHRAK